MAYSIDVVRSLAKHRATQALSIIAKVIQHITYYKQILNQQKMIESIKDEVLEELAKTSGVEVETARFVRAEAAFLGVLKAKVNLLNSIQENERALQEELRAEKEVHEADLIRLEAHLKAHFERLEKETRS